MPPNLEKSDRESSINFDNRNMIKDEDSVVFKRFSRLLSVDDIPAHKNVNLYFMGNTGKNHKRSQEITRDHSELTIQTI